jgi:exodeoxyribonuclease VII small subunit
MKKTQSKESIQAMLQELQTIVSWFESQKDVDVEKALEYVKKGSVIIKQSKERLKEIENEFKEIKKDAGLS